jgi:hypothetical protein
VGEEHRSATHDFFHAGAYWREPAVQSRPPTLLIRPFRLVFSFGEGWLHAGGRYVLACKVTKLPSCRMVGEPPYV